MAIVVEDGSTRIQTTMFSETEIVHLYSVCLHSTKTKLNRSLLSSCRLSLCQEKLGHCRDSCNSDSANNFDLPSANVLVSSSNIFPESGQIENNDRTLKELATPDVVYQPWCIQYPQLEPAQTYELKFGLIHLLPKFHGLAGED
ncbi:hypothetical protein CR513_24346, partial [Mucuna pruriens]